MCVGYRKLNSVTVSDTYSLPGMNDLMHAAMKAFYMSTLDLKSDYHKVSFVKWIVIRLHL